MLLTQVTSTVWKSPKAQRMSANSKSMRPLSKISSTTVFINRRMRIAMKMWYIVCMWLISKRSVSKECLAMNSFSGRDPHGSFLFFLSSLDWSSPRKDRYFCGTLTHSMPATYSSMIDESWISIWSSSSFLSTWCNLNKNQKPHQLKKNMS